MATIQTCQCGGYMDYKYHESNIIFTCQRCGEKKNGTDTDRNRRTSTYIDTNGIRLRKLLKYATVDPTNPMVKRNCINKNCVETITTYVESSGTMKHYYKCPTCLTVFT